MSRKLYIGNLSYSTTQADLETLFSQAGDVTSVFLSRDRYTSKSSGFAFVEMASEEATTSAAERFHGYVLADRPITVQLTEGSSSENAKGVAKTITYRKLPRPVEASKYDVEAPKNDNENG
jgi:RNA recognition motif-containing protein